MIEYDEDFYNDECDPDDDYGTPKQEPDCVRCNDYSWVRPRGYRRLLARIMPLALVWGTWRGLLKPWGTLHGWWPCPSCNPMWLDQLLGRWEWWRWHRRARHRRPAGNYDNEAPF